jgi:hypothetical protein
MLRLLHSSLPTMGKDSSQPGDKSMRNNYRSSICAFFFSIIMIVITPLISLAEEEKEKDNVSEESIISILSPSPSRSQFFFQHSATEKPLTLISYQGFAATIGNNTDTMSYPALMVGSSNYTENNLALSYSRQVGFLQVSGGYVYSALVSAYSVGSNQLNFREIFFKLGIDTIFSPTVIISKDIDRYQWSASVNLTHKIDFNEDVHLISKASASYSQNDNATAPFNFDNNSVSILDRYDNSHSGVVSLSLPISITKTLTIAPTISYAFSFSDDAKRELKGRSLGGVVNPLDREGVFAYCGVIIGIAF